MHTSPIAVYYDFNVSKELDDHSDMEELNDLEKAVLAKLLSGDHPLLAALRSQAERAWLVSRDYTGAGFYCSFAVPVEEYCQPRYCR
jgi:hypothetical protein